MGKLEEIAEIVSRNCSMEGDFRFVDDTDKFRLQNLIDEVVVEGKNILSQQKLDVALQEYVGGEASVALKEYNNVTLLALLVKSHCPLDIIEYLLLQGVDVNVQSGDDLNTPLHYALMTKNPMGNQMHLLLGYGADPDIQNKDGDTALHLAIKMKDYMRAMELCNAGSNIDITNAEGEKALALLETGGLKGGLESFVHNYYMKGGEVSDFIRDTRQKMQERAEKAEKARGAAVDSEMDVGAEPPASSVATDRGSGAGAAAGSGFGAGAGAGRG